jgi:hypothetical protein
VARSDLVLLLICWGVAAMGIASRASDEAAAEVLWTWATESSADPRDPRYIDAARACARIRPWQAGWAVCRLRLAWVDHGRAP